MNRKPKIVLAIDFDNTIAYTSYPKIDSDVPNAKRVINEFYDEGYGIIINTCREGLALADAINYLNDKGIKYDYINCNFPHRIEQFKADCRKISADCYIDDKNIDTTSIDWVDIRISVMSKFYEQLNK